MLIARGESTKGRRVATNDRSERVRCGTRGRALSERTVTWTVAVLLVAGMAACQAPSPAESVNTSRAPAPMDGLDAVANIRRDPESGIVVYAAGKDLSEALADDLAYRTAKEQQDLSAMSLRFLEAYRKDFLIDNPSSELEVSQITEDKLNFHRIRFRQAYKGIPVVGAELSLQYDAALALTLLQGRYVPSPQVSREDAEISPADARSTAAAELGEYSRLSDAELIIYPMPNGIGVLAYRLTATRDQAEGVRITIDATDGEVLAKEPLRYP